MDNLYNLISTVINNKYLKNIIFSNIYQFNDRFIKYRHEQSFKQSKHNLIPLKLKWCDLIEKPSALIGNGYIALWRQLLDRDDFSDIIQNNKKKYNEAVEDEYSASVSIIIEYDRLDLLQYLFSKWCRDSSWCFISIRGRLKSEIDLVGYAAAFGRLSIIKYILENNDLFRYEWNFDTALQLSSHSGNMEVFQFIYNKINTDRKGLSVKTVHTTLNQCAFYDQLEMVTFLWNEKRSKLLSVLTLDDSDSDDEVGDIQEQIYFIYFYSMLSNAIEGGVGTRVLRWILQEREEIAHDNYLIDLVASMDNDCDIQLEMIELLHSVGSLSTSQAMDDAANFGKLNIIEWLHLNSTEGCTINAMSMAISNNHLDVVKYLHQHRTEGYSQSAFDKIFWREESWDMVLFLHENRTEGCTSNAIDESAFRGQYGRVQWFLENRTEGYTLNAIRMALSSNNLDIVKLLYQKKDYLKDDLNEFLHLLDKPTLKYITEEYIGINKIII